MAALQTQFLINAKGKKTGVLLTLKQYQKLMEDLHDLAVIAERAKEPRVSLKSVKERLRRSGKI
ncbi:MAG: hypothetical protein AAB382_02765 [Chloroflexota bacterium]